MTGASRLSCPLRASPGLWAIWPTALTPRSARCDLEPVAPQEAFLNCLGDLLVSRAALVDVRTKLRQVADEVDGETVTRASAADLDDRIAGAAIKAVIAGDPEQRYPDLDPRSSDRRSPSLLDARTRQRRQAAALIGVAPMANDSGHGARHIRGGRRRPRDLLFMAATSAARFNADLVFERHKTAGKAHKVAIVAVMRKLWRTPCCDSSVAGRPKHR